MQQIVTEERLEPLSPDSCDYIISITSLTREAQDMKWGNVGVPASGLLPRPSFPALAMYVIWPTAG